MRRSKRIDAYVHAEKECHNNAIVVGACSCGQPHPEGARYYASVVERPGDPETPMVLAAGPFPSHPEALAMVDRVRALVLARFNPDGRAHWYGFGSVAMGGDFKTPGTLNAELGVAA